MNHLIEFILTKKMVIARVGVIVLVMAIFATQVFLLVKPASAGDARHRMDISPRSHSQGIDDTQAQDISPSDLAARRALECKAAAWPANVSAFSARYHDAPAEYCKALVPIAADLAIKRALECKAAAWISSEQANSSQFFDAKIEYCKALVAATSDPMDKRTAECESVARTASSNAFSARFNDAKIEYCKALGQSQ